MTRRKRMGYIRSSNTDLHTRALKAAITWPELRHWLESQGLLRKDLIVDRRPEPNGG